MDSASTDIAEDVDEMRVVGERATGTVRLSVPAFAASIVLAPRLRRFAHMHPGVHLDVVVDVGPTDIVADGFDAGIRPGERVQRDMVAVRVTPDLATNVVGAPTYLATRPAPRTPRDLREHACINHRFAGSGALYRWPFASGRDRFEVAVEGPPTLNDTGLVVAAALDGLGLAFTLAETVAGHVAAGRLVSVLPDWCPILPGFFIHHPGRRQTPPALRAPVDMLRLEEVDTSS